MEVNPYHCPKCKADTTQSIKMLFQTGVQHATSRTAMSGVGYGGGGLGVAVGTASTSSISSMALIRKYSMPPRPWPQDGRLLGGWACLGLSAVFAFGWWAAHQTMKDMQMGGDASNFLGMITIGSGILGVILVGTFPGHKLEIEKQRAAWDARHAYLDRTWVCFRCGAEWQPEG